MGINSPRRETTNYFCLLFFCLLSSSSDSAVHHRSIFPTTPCRTKPTSMFDVRHSLVGARSHRAKCALLASPARASVHRRMGFGSYIRERGLGCGGVRGAGSPAHNGSVLLGWSGWLATVRAVECGRLAAPSARPSRLRLGCSRLVRRSLLICEQRNSLSTPAREQAPASKAQASLRTPRCFGSSQCP